MVKKYSKENVEDWNKFCASSKIPMFMFNRGYMDYHSNRFIDSSLMFFDDDEMIGVFPASKSCNTLISHGGLTYGGIISSISMKQSKMNECVVLLLDYCANNGIKKLIYKFIPHIYHCVPSEEDMYSLSRYNPLMYKVEASTVIDLSNPQKMPKGRKAQITRAKREGVLVHQCTTFEEFKTFIDLENIVLKERHQTKAVHSADELYLLYTRFPDNIHLFAGKKDGKILSGVVLYEYDYVIHTQYMAASEEGRVIGALDYTVKTIIDIYKDKKKWLDFGISTEEKGAILNEGLIYQKESFGGRTNVCTTWEIEVSNL